MLCCHHQVFFHWLFFKTSQLLLPISCSGSERLKAVHHILSQLLAIFERNNSSSWFPGSCQAVLLQHQINAVIFITHRHAMLASMARWVHFKSIENWEKGKLRKPTALGLKHFYFWKTKTKQNKNAKQKPNQKQNSKSKCKTKTKLFLLQRLLLQ